MKIAAITMVFNEAYFLPIWLSHYGRNLGYSNLFVIDDGSTDGSTSDPRILNLATKRRSVLDEEMRSLLVSSFHKELLRFYDIVIYTDVDELIVVDPNLNVSLNEYLCNVEFDHTAPVGMNVLHRTGMEGPISLREPLFRQRRFVEFDAAYCKPLIARVPMMWTPGFHPVHFPIFDPHLFLFHLRSVDLGIARRRIKTLNQVRFSENAIQKGHSFHLRIQEEQYINLFFSTSESEYDGAHPNFEFVKQIREGKQVATRVARVPERFDGAVLLHFDKPPLSSRNAIPPANLEVPLAELFSCSLERTLEASQFRRNEPCPCGSNKRWKHCHGAYNSPRQGPLENLEVQSRC
jgi:hypothetical protein